MSDLKHLDQFEDMVECKFCDEEFDNKNDLHLHWEEEHEDELNSHQKEKVKKAKRKLEEEKDKKNAKRKKMAGMGLAGVGALAIIALLGSQLISMGGPSNSADLSIEGEPVIGNPDANVTIVEFADFQCPYCAQFNQQTYPQIYSNYIETGQVKMVAKDYPLTEIGHDWARPAAMTMECIYREGGDEAYFNVKETVYSNQNLLNGANVRSEIISYAEEENVSAEAVRSCMDNGNPGREVDRDKSQGRSAGVTGTPTVFVNGQEINAEYSSIRAAIEQQLR